MERGVIVGGLLISASFLGAMLLNRSAREEVPQAVAPKPRETPCQVEPEPVSKQTLTAPADPCAAPQAKDTAGVGLKTPLE